MRVAIPPRTLVLVDGEHYPPVVRSAVSELVASGHHVVGAALLGGTEKLHLDGAPDYGVPDVVSGASALDALLSALERFSPDVVVDLSDDPVLDARLRMTLAAHALVRGVAYRGADFALEPPPRPRLATKPTVAVVGTGKRTGKTAVAAALARLLAEGGTPPVIVAMGRGGPEEPELFDPAVEPLSVERLVALAESGRHAASDHLEDALMAGVTTIGTRRCGGGMAGAPFTSTFARGIELANARPETILLLEGSGTTIPPVHADTTVCVVPAHADPDVVTGYLGMCALLLADLVVVTLTNESHAVPAAVSTLEERIRGLVPGIPLVRTSFRPHPLEPIRGRTVFFATTAPTPVARELAGHLEREYGARIVGFSSHLADRRLLLEDLRGADGAEVVVTELKAAAVDLLTKHALERGISVTYCDNRPVDIDGDGVLGTHLRAVADAATSLFRAGSRGGTA